MRHFCGIVSAHSSGARIWGLRERDRSAAGWHDESGTELRVARLPRAEWVQHPSVPILSFQFFSFCFGSEFPLIGCFNGVRSVQFDQDEFAVAIRIRGDALCLTMSGELGGRDIFTVQLSSVNDLDLVIRQPIYDKCGIRIIV